MNQHQAPARFALALFMLAAALEAAAAQRTFVASSGLDSNACSLVAPCRSFQAAMAQTSPGGEVIVLDSAGYGGVTISQAVSIVAPPGIYAGVSVLSGTGIIVNAGAGNKVTLRGLTINGLGGTVAIAFTSGDALYVNNISIAGFSTPGALGISAALGASVGNLVIEDSIFRDNATALQTATGTGSLKLNVERSSFVRNGIGADLQGNTTGTLQATSFTGGTTGLSAGLAGSNRTLKVELRDCTVSDNSANGIVASATTSPTTLSVVSTMISGNGAIGLQVSNSGNGAYVSDSTITRNATGVSATLSGTIVSAQDNRLVDNTSNGTFTSTTPKI